MLLSLVMPPPLARPIHNKDEFTTSNRRSPCELWIIGSDHSVQNFGANVFVTTSLFEAKKPSMAGIQSSWSGTRFDMHWPIFTCGDNCFFCMRCPLFVYMMMTPTPCMKNFPVYYIQDKRTQKKTAVTTGMPQDPYFGVET